jgi:hypothetical protein
MFLRHAEGLNFVRKFVITMAREELSAVTYGIAK